MQCKTDDAFQDTGEEESAFRAARSATVPSKDNHERPQQCSQSNFDASLEKIGMDVFLKGERMCLEPPAETAAGNGQRAQRRGPIE